MNKDEILEKSRSAGEDEGVIHAQNVGRSRGYLAFYVVHMGIIFFNMFNHQPNFVPFALFFAYATAESYSQYRFTKQKTSLFVALISVSLCIFELVKHVLYVLP